MINLSISMYELNFSLGKTSSNEYLILKSKQLGSLLDEDPAIMERRAALSKRLELYRSAQAEIDAVAWAK